MCLMALYLAGLDYAYVVKDLDVFLFHPLDYSQPYNQTE